MHQRNNEIPRRLVLPTCKKNGTKEGGKKEKEKEKNHLPYFHEIPRMLHTFYFLASQLINLSSRVHILSLILIFVL